MLLGTAVRGEMTDARRDFVFGARNATRGDPIGSGTTASKTRVDGSRVASIGRWLCVGGAALGIFGLLGRILATTFLISVVPGQPPMMPNTALGLLLIGAAGSLRRLEDPGSAPRLLSVLAALIVLAIGVGTMAEYAFAVDLRIDPLLFVVPGGPYPGRPSPPAALALSLLAAALLVFDFRPAARARPSEWLVVSAGVVAFVGLTGFVFGAAPLYRLRHRARHWRGPADGDQPASHVRRPPARTARGRRHGRADLAELGRHHGQAPLLAGDLDPDRTRTRGGSDSPWPLASSKSSRSSSQG